MTPQRAACAGTYTHSSSGLWAIPRAILPPSCWQGTLQPCPAAGCGLARGAGAAEQQQGNQAISNGPCLGGAAFEQHDREPAVASSFAGCAETCDCPLRPAVGCGRHCVRQRGVGRTCAPRELWLCSPQAPHKELRARIAGGRRSTAPSQVPPWCHTAWLDVHDLTDQTITRRGADQQLQHTGIAGCRTA